MGRPQNVVECIANDDGTMFCNGEIFQAVNSICVDADDAIDLKSHCMDMEKRLYICLKFPKRCN